MTIPPSTSAAFAVGRRGVIAGIGAAASALAVAPARSAPPAAGATAPDADKALRAAFASGADGLPDVTARLAFLADDALVVADDVPFALDRAAYADHLTFERTQSDSLEMVLDAVESRRHGDTATVSAFYIARGKPKGAGYRLRAGYLTATCVRQAGQWRAVGLHMAPLSGQLRDASPS